MGGALSEILNRNDQTNPVEEDEKVESEETEEIDLRRWRVQEVKDALKRTISSRADMGDTARWLTSCYNARLWETERWQTVWKKGLVVKVFKKS